MLTRIFDLFLGLCIGRYVPPTITVFGLAMPWDLIGLGMVVMFWIFIKVMSYLFKKFGRILLNKILKALKKALKEAVKEALQEELNN